MNQSNPAAFKNERDPLSFLFVLKMKMHSNLKKIVKRMCLFLISRKLLGEFLVGSVMIEASR